MNSLRDLISSTNFMRVSIHLDYAVELVLEI